MLHTKGDVPSPLTVSRVSWWTSKYPSSHHGSRAMTSCFRGPRFWENDFGNVKVIIHNIFSRRLSLFFKDSNRAFHSDNFQFPVSPDSFKVWMPVFCFCFWWFAPFLSIWAVDPKAWFKHVPYSNMQCSCALWSQLVLNNKFHLDHRPAGYLPENFLPR